MEETKYMAKMRVHELAKELGIESKQIIELLSATEHAVKTPSSNVDDAAQQLVRGKLTKGGGAVKSENEKAGNAKQETGKAGAAKEQGGGSESGRDAQNGRDAKGGRVCKGGGRTSKSRRPGEVRGRKR